MTACYRSALWEPLGAAARHLNSAAELTRQAEALVVWAKPTGWQSPAASMYQLWCEDTRRRCAAAQSQAGQSAEMMSAYQAMLPLWERP
ncbi:MAG: hypothetical protein LBD90_09615 [Bifidobacteriaceae bacterium]|jgi:hypothetical protein|nr:hypothetical protein [Bifidobacteriaceae bacterium]